jgi:hypothetical protein
MRLATALLACSLALGCAGEARGKSALHDWADRNPEASQELCAWSAQHLRASDQLLSWESRNPERAQELINWSVQNPGYGWEHFVAQRPEFKDFAALASQHPRAVNQQLDWARRHPQAAIDLVSHPGAERFAGKRNAC